MNRLYKLIPYMLTVVLVFQMTIPFVQTEDTTEEKTSILMQNIDEENQTASQMFKWDQNIFYVYADNNISYSSQITSTGKICFSYILKGSAVLVESKLYADT